MQSDLYLKKTVYCQNSGMNHTKKKKSVFLISITGGSATGKSSILKELSDKFGDQITIISQDDYYKPIKFQHKDEKGIYNFDLPDAIDHVEFLNDLYKISTGETVERPEYTFNHPDKIPAIKCFKPNMVIIVEGLFVLYKTEIERLVDFKVFISADEDICFERRRKRDIDERGIPEDVFLHQWNYHVLPAYRKYVAKYKEESDFIIDNNNNYSKGLKQLSELIENKMKKQ